MQQLSLYYKFEERFCNARSGWETGSVERSVEVVSRAISFFVMVMLSYSPLRPWAIFPKWKTIRRIIRRTSRDELAELAEDLHKNIVTAD